MDIAPDKQNIDRLFSNTTFYIDFYQREYKWTEEPIRRLIDDVFYKFEETYKLHSDIDPGLETVAAHYPWYYLNTYVTNTISGRVYVVDGQQRLTTLTLFLMKLSHLAAQHGSQLSDWIKAKIVGQDGYKRRFWMNHERHLATLDAILNNSDTVPVDSGVTAVNILTNFKSIGAELDKRLDTLHKLDTFIFYFLHRLVLINLSVEQTDVPMVFEVINDRGVKLKPYEILKGKLLGQIDKVELDKDDYNGLWERSIDNVNSFYDDEIDIFFSYFLKAKYADSRSLGKRFDNDYHREMFKRDIDEQLKLEHNPKSVKAFLNGPLRYYTALYAKFLKWSAERTPGKDEVYFNNLNEMDSQFHLILSACRVDDPEEGEKITLISKGVDRLFAMLRLQRAYDSNEFQDMIYEISRQIRDGKTEDVKQAFEAALLRMLSRRRGTEVTEPFEYAQFKNTTITDVPTRFTRYLFARVDEFIAQNTNVSPKHDINDLVMKTGHVNGFHIEHILSNNDENLGMYDDDEERFEIDRNRLGAVLLLKGRDNISSSNERFKNKLKSYANTLYWNETLRADSYKAKKDMSSFIESKGLAMRAYDSFGPDEVEERQKLLFAVAAYLWPSLALEQLGSGPVKLLAQVTKG